jgi:multicomponent Na+:H+ antiporter subunit G
VSISEAAQAVLLLMGVGIVLASCVGLLIGNSFDRLHYLGPPTVLAPIMIAAAVTIRDLSSATVVKGILLALAFLLSSPILTHATGAAGYQHGTEIDPKKDCSDTSRPAERKGAA